MGIVLGFVILSIYIQSCNLCHAFVISYWIYEGILNVCVEIVLGFDIFVDTHSIYIQNDSRRHEFVISHWIYEGILNDSMYVSDDIKHGYQKSGDLEYQKLKSKSTFWKFGKRNV